MQKGGIMDQVTKSEVQLFFITIITLILCLRERARKLLSLTLYVKCSQVGSWCCIAIPLYVQETLFLNLRKWWSLRLWPTSVDSFATYTFCPLFGLHFRPQMRRLYAWAGNESTHGTLAFICSQLLQQILQLVVCNLSIAFSDDVKDIVLHCYAMKFLHDRSIALILSAEKDDCGRS